MGFKSHSPTGSCLSSFLFVMLVEGNIFEGSFRVVGSGITDVDFSGGVGGVRSGGVRSGGFSVLLFVTLGILAGFKRLTDTEVSP